MKGQLEVDYSTAWGSGSKEVRVATSGPTPRKECTSCRAQKWQLNFYPGGRRTKAAFYGLFFVGTYLSDIGSKNSYLPDRITLDQTLAG